MKKFANVALVALLMVTTSVTMGNTVEGGHEVQEMTVDASGKQWFSVNVNGAIGSVPGN